MNDFCIRKGETYLDWQTRLRQMAAKQEELQQATTQAPPAFDTNSYAFPELNKAFREIFGSSEPNQTLEDILHPNHNKETQ